MRSSKIITALSVSVVLVFFCTADASAQRLRWKRSKPETLYARNKKKQVTPVYIGIGTKTPTAQLHTVGSIRFEGLTVNNNLNTVVAVDGSGNLFWRDISNSNSNAWFLNGNTIGASNFFGTTNSEDIRIRTNNTQRAVITSAGFLGLGVAAPAAQLHTNGTVRFEGLINNDLSNRVVSIDNNGNLFWRDAASMVGTTAWLLNGNNATASSFLGTTVNEDLRIRTNNIQRAVISSSGSLGLGVATPSAQFHTNGSVRFEGVTNNNTFQRLALFDNNGNLFYRDVASLQSNFWSLTGNTGTSPATNFVGTTDNNRLVFRTNNTEKMTILPNGNVGINTTNPTSSLEINNATPDNHIVVNGVAPSINFRGTGLGPNDGGRVGFATQNNNFTQGSLPSDFIVQTLGATANLIFGTGGGGTGNGIERARINSVGYFGIATLTPSAKLHVNCSPVPGQTNPSNFRLENLQTGTGNALLIDANGYVYASTGGASNAWNLTGNAATNPAINFLGTTDNNRLVFRTNNTEKMTILADGSVGIGLTNPSSPLHVYSPLTDNQLFLSGAAPSTRYFQGTDWLASPYHARIGMATGNANYVTTSSPGDFIVQAMDNSNLIFGAGVVAGNGLERMRLTSIGYFGIATLVPSAKLHVNCAPVAGQTNPSNIRFENLPTGTGNALVMDANGYVYKSSTLTGRPTNNEITELKDEVQDLKKEIEALKSVVNSMKGGVLMIEEKKNEAILYQNAPNPFKNATIVRYFIPEGSQSSSLIVNDLQGNVLKSYRLNGESEQSITINGGELSAGTYLYTLFVNGREVDSKKMILTR